MTQSKPQAAELKQLNVLLREKIDELKKTEAALRESEKRYALAVQGSRDGLWDWDLITDEVYCSPRFKAILGHQDTEMVYKFSELESRLHPDDRDRVIVALQQHLRQKAPYDAEYRLRTKQGNYCWIYARGQAIWDDSGRPTRMAGSITDITERKQMEDQLKDSLKELADVKFALDRSSILAITDAQGRITEVNDQFCEISGYGRSELIGKTHRLINSGHHPPEFFQAMWQTITRGTVWQGEIKNRAKDGSFYWVHTTIVPIVGESGELLQFVAIRNNITERKQAEAALRQLNDELERQVQARTQELEQRAKELERSNAELEQFAYVASHDLQQPLQSILGFGQLLALTQQAQLDDAANGYVNHIITASQQMSQLIQDLLAYAKVGAAEQPTQPIDCDQLVQTIISEIAPTVEAAQGKISMQTLPTVIGKPSQLRQLFQNLLSNALKYRSSDRVPQVKISVERQGKAWCFSVEDNGIGIEPEHFDKIFQIFQRLHSKEDYPGTGIGLATCKKIVENHQGRIWIASEPGVGTTVYFTLPAVY